MPEPNTPSSVEEVLRELEWLLRGKASQWLAEYREGGTFLPHLVFIGKNETKIHFFPTDDIISGSATMILLDLLESLGFRPALFRMGDVYFCTAPNGEYFQRQEGKTRSEAIARAVLAVLSQQEREGNTNV